MPLRVTFYDVPAEERWPTIFGLAEASLRKGMRMVIHCATDAAAEELDEWLWTFRDDAFLPHERAVGSKPLKDDQAKVVLVSHPMNPHAATILVQDAPVPTEFAQTFETVIDLVDQRSDAALAASRQRYKDWRDVPNVKLDYRKS